MYRLLAAASLFSCLSAFAAESITGVVTNKTTGKVSAGDDVTLVRLAQGMQDSTHTKTDSRGHFTLEVPDDGMHLIRVTHDKATYFRPAPPGTQSVDIDVYNAAERVDGVSTDVEELHIEATSTELHVVEVIQVQNKSTPARTQFGPAGYDFYLPEGAVIQRTAAITEGGMPVQSAAIPVGDPNHYKLLFPIRPGETQFGIFYNLPYSGSYKFNAKLAVPIATFAVLVPKSIKIVSGASTNLNLSPVTNPTNNASNTYIQQNVTPAQAVEFTISGQGELPRDAAKPQQAQDGESGQVTPETQNTAPGRGLQNPLDPEGDRDPWGRYKWWILGGLALMLAAAAGVLLKKPAPTSAPPAVPLAPASTHVGGHDALVLQALKEELFALETERLQNRVSEHDYASTKAALELILSRALARTSGKDAVSA